MSVKIDLDALREEAAPTREHGLAPRPVILSLPVQAPDYQARLTSEQFLTLADEIVEATEKRRRALEDLQVQAIGQDPADDVKPPKRGRKAT